MTDGISSTRSLRDGVAEEVRALLARKRMTGDKLAAAIDRSPMYVSRRLRGEVPFDLDDLERIADALGVIVLHLLPRQALQPRSTVDEDTTRYRSDADRMSRESSAQRVRPVSAPPKRRPKVNASPAGTSPPVAARRPAMIQRLTRG